MATTLLRSCRPATGTSTSPWVRHRDARGRPGRERRRDRSGYTRRSVEPRPRLCSRRQRRQSATGTTRRRSRDYLYGTTITSDSDGTVAGGLAFKAQPSAGGSFNSLGPLPSNSAGRPSNALFVGSDGNLYGTSVVGGNLTAAHCAGVGCGMLFQMTPRGTFTTVYAFQGGSEASPNTPPLPR